MHVVRLDIDLLSLNGKVFLVAMDLYRLYSRYLEIMYLFGGTFSLVIAKLRSLPDGESHKKQLVIMEPNCH